MNFDLRRSPLRWATLWLVASISVAGCGEAPKTEAPKTFTAGDIHGSSWELSSGDFGTVYSLEGVLISFSVNRVLSHVDKVVDQGTSVLLASDFDHCQVTSQEITIDEVEGSGLITVERSLSFPPRSRGEWGMDFDLSEDGNTITLQIEMVDENGDIIRAPLTLTRAATPHVIDNLEDCDSQE